MGQEGDLATEELPTNRADALRQLEGRLQVRFEDRRLLERALRHRSAANEQGRSNNERLEFLGDAVLGAATATWLLSRFPEEPEGRLARRKSFLVSRESLHHWALVFGLQGLLELGVGEERSGGRGKLRAAAAARGAGSLRSFGGRKR